MRTQNQRGQTLLLMALTLLVLVGMVLTTLNLAARTKGRLEMQTIADANAYSNAVVTARAFNGVSLLNRASLATYAAQAAAASYISYGTQGLAFNRALRNSIQSAVCAGPAFNTCCAGFYAGKASAVAELDARYNEMLARFDELDSAASAHVTNTQGFVGTMRDAAEQILLDMEQHIAGGGQPNVLSTRIRDAAHLDIAQAGPLEWLGTHGVNRRETTDGFSGDGAVSFSPNYNMTMVEAAMGTRAGWTINGTSTPHFRDQQICARYGFSCTGTASGGAYWSGSRHGAMSTTYSYADHHGIAIVSSFVPPPCAVVAPPTPATAHVRSTDNVNPQGEHMWSPGDGDGHSDQKDDHKMGRCEVCPAVWVRAYAFNPGKPADDVWGQPKSYAAVRKNLAAASNDPWNRLFRIRLPGSTEPSQWDLRTEASTDNGLQFQHAMGTGIAYYHRAEAWDEPANFLNPFWRATLTHGYIDDSAPDDISGIFSGVSAPAADGMKALQDAKHVAFKRNP